LINSMNHCLQLATSALMIKRAAEGDADQSAWDGNIIGGTGGAGLGWLAAQRTSQGGFPRAAEAYGRQSLMNQPAGMGLLQKLKQQFTQRAKPVAAGLGEDLLENNRLYNFLGNSARNADSKMPAFLRNLIQSHPKLAKGLGLASLLAVPAGAAAGGMFVGGAVNSGLNFLRGLGGGGAPAPISPQSTPPMMASLQGAGGSSGIDWNALSRNPYAIGGAAALGGLGLYGAHKMLS